MLSLILKQKRSRVASVKKKKKKSGYGTCQDVKRPINLKNCVVAVVLYVNSNLFSPKNCLSFTMPGPAFCNQISFKAFDFLYLTH